MNTTVLHDLRSVGSMIQNCRYRRADFEHQWFLLPPAGLGTNLLWLMREECTFQRLTLKFLWHIKFRKVKNMYKLICHENLFSMEKSKQTFWPTQYIRQVSRWVATF